MFNKYLVIFLTCYFCLTNKQNRKKCSNVPHFYGKRRDWITKTQEKKPTRRKFTLDSDALEVSSERRIKRKNSFKLF